MLVKRFYNMVNDFFAQEYPFFAKYFEFYLVSQKSKKMKKFKKN